jgi:hypothetical protein
MMLFACPEGLNKSATTGPIGYAQSLGRATAVLAANESRGKKRRQKARCCETDKNQSKSVSLQNNWFFRFKIGGTTMHAAMLEKYVFHLFLCA